MNWKVWTAAGLAALCIAWSAGCGSEPAKEKGETPILHAATHANWNPFEYLDKGEITGFDIDLIRAMAEKAGYQIEITDTGWEAIFEQIRQGQTDLAISGITITKDREQGYAFSRPYFVSRQAILTADPAVNSAKDLAGGKTIAVQNGSTGQEAMEKLLGKNAPALKKTPMSIQMLVGGQADAIVGDATSVSSIARQYPDQHFRIVYDDSAFTPEFFGIMYPKNGDPAIREKLDAALAALIKDGTYAKIYSKWFHEEPDAATLQKLTGGKD